MAPSKLAPVGAVLALVLQGCVIDEFRPAVKIAIGRECTERIDEIADQIGLKKIAQTEACDLMDQSRLKALNVTDCPQAMHDILHRVFALQCDFKVASAVKDICHPLNDVKEKACKAAVDAMVADFHPGPVNEPEEAKAALEAQGFEAVLGLAQVCHAQLAKFMNSTNATKEVKEVCSDLDRATMDLMEVKEEHCNASVERNELGSRTMDCVLRGAESDKAPPDGEGLGLEDLEALAEEYMATVDLEHENFSIFDGPKSVERLRLFETAVKERKWPGKARAWPLRHLGLPGGAAAAAAVLLALLAWARRTRLQRAQAQMPEADAILSAE